MLPPPPDATSSLPLRPPPLDWGFASKERAQKNTDSRAKRKWESRNGSRSTARHHVVRGANLDAPTGHIETWHLRHWHFEHGWSSPELEAKYEQMMQLRRDNPPNKMTDKDILEKVLG
ncbi:uncharacterized protein LOC127812592 isoform X1 [Diospyros lotus]|uniref:uncharacterized protein LOC127812592 isoform X1 n=1 Tax=Diospyros lotus TaxID=55363 RepID=UPI00225BEBCC|nr:uncharacterized protein LOC127812592 isoform X1 [Diospyros lotus]